MQLRDLSLDKTYALTIKRYAHRSDVVRPGIILSLETGWRAVVDGMDAQPEMADLPGAICGDWTNRPAMDRYGRLRKSTGVAAAYRDFDDTWVPIVVKSQQISPWTPYASGRFESQRVHYLKTLEATQAADHERQMLDYVLNFCGHPRGSNDEYEDEDLNLEQDDPGHDLGVFVRLTRKELLAIIEGANRRYDLVMNASRSERLRQVAVNLSKAADEAHAANLRLRAARERSSER